MAHASCRLFRRNRPLCPAYNGREQARVGASVDRGGGLILANAFFIEIEFALTRVRQYPGSGFDEPSLHRAWGMTLDLEIYLTGCQSGSSATNNTLGISRSRPFCIELFFRNTFLASVGTGAVLRATAQGPGIRIRLRSTPLSLGVVVAKWMLRRFGSEMTGSWLETERDIIDARGDFATGWPPSSSSLNATWAHTWVLDLSWPQRTSSSFMMRQGPTISNCHFIRGLPLRAGSCPLPRRSRGWSRRCGRWPWAWCGGCRWRGEARCDRARWWS